MGSAFGYGKRRARGAARKLLDWQARQKIEHGFERNFGRLQKLAETHQSDLLTDMLQVGRALKTFQTSIPETQAKIRELRPGIFKRVVPIIGSSLIATAYVAIVVPTYETAHRLITGKYDVTNQDIKDLYKGGVEIGDMEARAYAAFLNSVQRFDTATVKLYIAYSQLAHAMLAKDTKAIKAAYPEYVQAKRLLIKSENSMGKVYERYAHALNNFSSIHATCKMFLIDAGITIASLGTAGLILKVARMVPKPIAVSRAGRLIGIFGSKSVLPVLRPTGVAASAGLAYAFDVGQSRTMYNAWRGGQEYVELDGKRFIVTTDKQGKKSIQTGLGLAPIVEKAGEFFYGGKKVALKTAQLEDFLDALTMGWLKISGEMVVFSGVLGAAGKGISLGWRFARGTEKIIKIVAASGVPQRVEALLARSGATINLPLGKALAQLIIKNPRKGQFYKVLKEFGISKETAYKIAGIVKEAWKQARGVLREERAGKIGASTRWLLKHVEATTHLLL